MKNSFLDFIQLILVKIIRSVQINLNIPIKILSNFQHFISFLNLLNIFIKIYHYIFCLLITIIVVILLVKFAERIEF